MVVGGAQSATATPLLSQRSTRSWSIEPGACSHRISTFSYITFCSSTAVGSISSETRICTTRGVACHISKDEERNNSPAESVGESRARSVTEEECRRLD